MILAGRRPDDFNGLREFQSQVGIPRSLSELCSHCDEFLRMLFKANSSPLILLLFLGHSPGFPEFARGHYTQFL